MEVPVLCIRLSMCVLLMLITQFDHIYSVQKDVTFPRVIPDKLQFFEYDTVSVYCDEIDSTEWRVMRKILDINTTNYSHWDTSASTCIINPAYSRYSGTYWCENKEGKRSDAVNITITGDSVILESPVRPVLEGSSVILRCKKRKNASISIADFYKDGIYIKTGYKGEITIINVSVSDEGLYKCNISGVGESPESQLSVEVYKDTHTEQNPSSTVLTPWRIAVSVLLVTLVLLVIGVLLCLKAKESWLLKAGTSSHSTEDEAIYSQISF
ncbi:high affinity immunoglobulin gamma Fc receptor I-like isoform X2 [Anabas testudineus]|uniref:high affinity immunoglobulin gamma Fc receptor I-like isoform X2 n=1 Tax=Anabas testudineus TaxID=64144 RepID=UPI000E46257B|nr:high affinity immunoglobulin gamma Fc receptor I-like isoform X2 [Anabas testudineus]